MREEREKVLKDNEEYANKYAKGQVDDDTSDDDDNGMVEEGN
jgi:hypothetical protein